MGLLSKFPPSFPGQQSLQTWPAPASSTSSAPLLTSPLRSGFRGGFRSALPSRPPLHSPAFSGTWPIDRPPRPQILTALVTVAAHNSAGPCCCHGEGTLIWPPDSKGERGSIRGRRTALRAAASRLTTERHGRLGLCPQAFAFPTHLFNRLVRLAGTHLL